MALSVFDTVVNNEALANGEQYLLLSANHKNNRGVSSGAICLEHPADMWILGDAFGELLRKQFPAQALPVLLLFMNAALNVLHGDGIPSAPHPKEG